MGSTLFDLRYIANNAQSIIDEDNISPAWYRILKSYEKQICSIYSDIFDSALEFYKSDIKADPITEAISKKSRSSTCNYVNTKSKCDFDYAVNQSYLLPVYGSLLALLIMISLI